VNIGTAMNNPAWSAIVPELVPREMLADAVTLNSVSNNWRAHWGLRWRPDGGRVCGCDHGAGQYFC